MMMAACHCSQCRKASASCFVFVKRQSLQWIRGRDRAACYRPESPYKYTRCFCSLCGTALGEITSDSDSLPVAANWLDADPLIRNRFHAFVAEKPAWYYICDDARQFDSHPVPGE